MVLKFKDFVNEEAINENPALAAVATQVASDVIAKKMSEGYGVDEMVEMIKEGAKCYEEDEHEDHTAEGYMNEVCDKVHEAVSDAAKKAAATKAALKQAVNTKSAHTQAFAKPPEQ
tara:strand:- start:54 stop:401 length:348 start_codon:yes stop_codon:yes gene_type:complete